MLTLCLQYFGGTNFGRTSGGPNYITSYDYDAPLDEYGNILTNIELYKSNSLLRNIRVTLHEFILLTFKSCHPQEMCLFLICRRTAEPTKMGTLEGPSCGYKAL